MGQSKADRCCGGYARSLACQVQTARRASAELYMRAAAAACFSPIKPFTFGPIGQKNFCLSFRLDPDRLAAGGDSRAAENLARILQMHGIGRPAIQSPTETLWPQCSHRL